MLSVIIYSFAFLLPVNFGAIFNNFSANSPPISLTENPNKEDFTLWLVVRFCTVKLTNYAPGLQLFNCSKNPLVQPSSRFDELPDDFDFNGKLPGSFDDGDPQTTNLYVGNLSPQVRNVSIVFKACGQFMLKIDMIVALLFSCDWGYDRLMKIFF